MFYGRVDFNDETYFFRYENFSLELFKKDFTEDVWEAIRKFDLSSEKDPSILIGTLIDSRFKEIHFFIKKGVSGSVHFEKFEVYAHLLLNEGSGEFDKITIMNDELNWFYNVHSAYDYSIQGEAEESTASLKPNLGSSEKHIFDFKGKEIEANLNVSRSTSSNSRHPIRLDSSLSFTFEKTNETIFIIDLHRVFSKFISFVTYRKNIDVGSVGVFKQLENKRYRQIGELSVKEDDSLLIEERRTIQEEVIPYEFIKDGVANLLDLISDSKIYTEHIPNNSKDKEHITPASFLLTTSAFEWEFKNIYGEVNLEENENLNEVHTKMLEAMKEIKEIFTGKKRRYAKSYISRTTNTSMSLADKIEYAFKEHNEVINDFINHLYLLNGIKEYSYSTMAFRLADQRNNYAHGNIDINIDGTVILDLVALEWLIYSMRLRNVGIEDINIKRSINKLFKRNMLV